MIIDGAIGKDKPDPENSFRKTTMAIGKRNATRESKKNSTRVQWYTAEREPRNDKEIIINLANTKYPIIEYIAKKVFNWKVIKNEKAKEWDIMWCDGVQFLFYKPQRRSKETF
jgi:hypothetical protein